jgi:profilin
LGAFTNPEETQAKGIRLAGEKFFTLQANERSVYGKKRVRGSIHFLSSQGGDG